MTAASAVGAVMMAVFLAGCGGVESLSFPAVPVAATAVATTSSTVAPDYTTVALAPVPGATTTTLAMGPGQATITGTVLGPQGPVSGATVQAQRLVGDGAASVEVTTGADGSFAIDHLLGGRFSVRAWEAPSLAQTAPQIFFLAGTGTSSLTLQVAPFTGPDIAAAMRPRTPIVADPVNLVLQVTNPTVGPDGVVRDLALVDANVQLTSSGGWDVLSANNPVTTSIDGEALFELVCTAPGTQALLVSVDGAAATPLNLPDCAAPPPPTTTSMTPPAPTSSTLFPGALAGPATPPSS